MACMHTSRNLRTLSAVISTQPGRVLIVMANCGRFKSYLKLKAELPPQRVHAALHHRVHDDRPAPAPRRFARPFCRGVDAHLRAEACTRAGEVEVIDRRVLRDQAGARRTY